MATINPATLPLKRTFGLRILEILPGLSSWLFILSPLILSFTKPLWVAYIIIAYDLMWLTKSVGLSYRLIRGYRRLRATSKVNWQQRLEDLNDLEAGLKRTQERLKRNRLPSRLMKGELKSYRHQLRQLLAQPVDILDPKKVYHGVIVAVYNESLDILEPTLRALTSSHYNLKKLWLYLAYEQRGGEQVAKDVKDLVARYGSKFGHMEAVMHPSNIRGEVKAKAGNITYAGRRLATRAKQQQISPANMLVTTLDSDNRPHPNYFAYLTFKYCTEPDRVHCSYQPLPMYYNNIWDVPAPMRIIATGNSFWQLMEAMRPHRMRNFSAHAQSLRTLIDTDFWNVRSVVEDGHQFWRTYFTYHGNHRVVPLHTPVYQDAVLARGYLKTFRAQFLQTRRWAWGVSDIPYIIVNSWRDKQTPRADKLWKLARHWEGHFGWATSPLILAFAAWTPLLINPELKNEVWAYQLPQIAGRIQAITLIGAVITIVVSLISLPPRPTYHKRSRSLFMVGQWALLPFVTIIFSAMAALNAQTRLMFGRYLENFDVTDKVTLAQHKAAALQRPSFLKFKPRGRA